MKWNAWNKWPWLGVAATAAVLAAPADDGLDGMESAGAPKPVAQASPSALPQEAAHAPAAPTAGKQAMRVELERLRRARPEAAPAEKAEVSNVFDRVSWYEPPPPPPPPQPVPEEAPVAPPVPFTYFGRYEDPPKRIVMLARNEEVFTVSEGDVIDDTYRIERIADGMVAIVYLPLGANQTISMGTQ